VRQDHHELKINLLETETRKQPIYVRTKPGRTTELPGRRNLVYVIRNGRSTTEEKKKSRGETSGGRGNACCHKNGQEETAGASSSGSKGAQSWDKPKQNQPNRLSELGKKRDSSSPDGRRKKNSNRQNGADENRDWTKGASTTPSRPGQRLFPRHHRKEDGGGPREKYAKRKSASDREIQLRTKKQKGKHFRLEIEELRREAASNPSTENKRKSPAERGCGA